MTTPQPMAVEGLLPGDLVQLEGGTVARLTSPATGHPTGFRGIGDPRIIVEAYAYAVTDQPPSLEHARHLSWPAGTVVQVVRP